MRLDLCGFDGLLLGHARENVLGAVFFGLGGHVGDLRVRVRERDLSDVGIDRMLAAAVSAFEFDLDAKTANAPGPVTGTGPSGQIEAGSFRATMGGEQDGDGEAGGQIWFENGVRLVFSPNKGSEKQKAATASQ